MCHDWLKTWSQSRTGQRNSYIWTSCGFMGGERGMFVKDRKFESHVPCSRKPLLLLPSPSPQESVDGLNKAEDNTVGHSSFSIELFLKCFYTQQKNNKKKHVNISVTKSHMMDESLVFSRHSHGLQMCRIRFIVHSKCRREWIFLDSRR